MKNSTKAVSTVLGYTMILGIIVLVLSLVFSHTYTMVTQAKEKVKYESMAQGFEKIQNMIDYVAYSGTTERYVRILLNGGTVSVNKGSYLEISVYNTTSENPVYTFKGYTGSIDYTYRNYVIAFENGGVWLSSQNTSIIVSPPRIFIYKKTLDNQTVFFMALTILNGSGSVGGDSFSSVIVKSNSSNVKIFGAGYAKVNITSKFARSWYSYFENLKKQNPSIQVLQNKNNVFVIIHFSEMVLTKYNLNVRVS